MKTKSKSQVRAVNAAIATAKEAMYQRTVGLPIEKSDELRIWINKTLAEVILAMKEAAK